MALSEKDYHKLDFDYCEPLKKPIKGVIGVYRAKNTGRMERYGIETDGYSYLRVYQDDVDGGSDFLFPDNMVRAFFRKIKRDKIV